MASNTVSILQFFNDDLQLRGAAIRDLLTCNFLVFCNKFVTLKHT